MKCSPVFSDSVGLTEFYSLETNVEISDQFYGWVSGFGRRVSLLGEKDVVDGYRAYLDKLRGMYPEKDGQ